MTGQQLKNSILQMAVQGKLVPQDPNDEPAAVLLERIRKEKEQLIKDGKIKKEKNPSYIFRGADNLPYEKVGKKEPVCIADEVPFEIPESWEWVRLGSIGETNIGLTYKPSDKVDERNGIAVLRSNNIQKGKIDYNDMIYVSCNVPERAMIGKGDILICARNGSRSLVGKSAIVDMDGMAFGAFMAKYTSFLSGMLNAYILMFIESPVFRCQLDGVKTETINQITQNMIREQLIPIPPLEEQLRINKKLAEIMPYIEKYGTEHLEVTNLNDTFPASLKKSILQEAVQGKLVPQNPSDEPAFVLLERIRAEKERLIQEGKIKRNKYESVIYRRDNSHYEKRGSEEVCIDDEIPFEIPENWCWCRLRSFGIFSSGKTPSMQNPDYWNGTVPWVSSKDMKKPVINDSEMHITELAAETMQLYPAGTLLLVARSGILRRLLPLCILGVDSTINQDIKAFTLYDTKTSPWIYYAIKAFEPYILKELVKSVTTVESLKFDEFISMLIPIPPEKEQIRIIVALKDALSLLTPLSKNPLFSL